MSQDEDEDEDTEEFTEECSSPEVTRGDLTPNKTNKKISGVIPKDIESKKEMMSFITYPQHLEYACKLISNSKAVCLTEGTHDKNRIYLSGTSIMSTKLNVSLAQSRKICEEIKDHEMSEPRIRKTNYLDKQPRAACTLKMKNHLQAVLDLQ